MTQPAMVAQFRGRPVDIVVDVRSKLEYWLGHLPGAVCIPLDRVVGEISKLAGITTASSILLYCASGARSAAAARELQAAGYRNVVDAGGIAAAGSHFTPAGGH